MVKSKTEASETDSAYFLKIVMYFLIGAIWLNISVLNFQLPVGLVIGLIFASHDHFQIDRKIEYAVLLLAAILSFVTPIGLVITVR